MNVHVRAVFVARIFDVLAWVILVVGALAALSGIIYLFSSGVEGLFIFFVAIVYTVLAWAGVSLAAVVAGYIAQRTEVAPPGP
jgi:hypothetical protein